jgi:hypothetical protein
VAERLPHKLGTRAVFLFANFFELSRHGWREGDRHRFGGSHEYY